MDRRKFLKSFALVPVALTAGCVATFNGKETKFDPNPVPTEKKHFERSPISAVDDDVPKYEIAYDKNGGWEMVQTNPHVKAHHEFHFDYEVKQFIAKFKQS